MQIKILKNIFGQKYKFQTTMNGARSLNLQAKRFSQPSQAYRFLLNFRKPEHFWRGFVSNSRANITLNPHDEPLKLLSKLLVKDKIRIFTLLADNTLTQPAENRVLKNKDGHDFHFVPAIEQLLNENLQIKSFANKTAAAEFLNDISPNDDQLKAIAEIMDTTGSAGGTTTATSVVSTLAATSPALAKVSEGLISGDIVVLVKKNEAIVPLGADLEDAIETPGSRKAGLGPEPAVNASIRLVISGWDYPAQKQISISGADWKMNSPESKTGKTGGNGLIDVEVPAATASSVVEVTWRVTAAKVVAPVNAATHVSDYPQKILHEQWEDTDAGDVIPKPEDDKVKWNFTVVKPARMNNDAGLKDRLYNLGFSTTDLAAAVKGYQYLYMSTPNGSGNLADIKADLINRHDNP